MEELKKKYDLTDEDIKNLVRFNNVRKLGVNSIKDYLWLMDKYNVNGGSRLAQWITEHFKEFVEVM